MNVFINNRPMVFFSILLLAGCMPQLEDESLLQPPEVSSHSIEKVGGNNIITFTGTCPTDSKKLNFTTSASSYVEITKSSSQPATGSMSGTCTNGVMTLMYNVPNPTASRRITFKLKSTVSDGRSTRWTEYPVNYTPAASGLPGFAISSGGGRSINTGVEIQSTLGSVTSPITISGGSRQIFTGLRGVLAP